MHHRELAEEERVRERRPPEPAPPPLHALLALQQSAGNQAVGRVLARAMYKPSEVRSEVKQAKAGGAATKQAILLAIYNELRLTIDPTPKPFTKVDTAVAALLGKRIDQEDADAFDAEADAVISGKPVDRAATAEAALKKGIKDKRESVKGRYAKHIFFGEFMKSDGVTPTGYHSVTGPSTTHQKFGARTNIATDAEGEVYQQSVRSVADPTKKKKYQSTFFPDDAEQDDVIAAIATVEELGYSSVQYPAKLKGMKLRKTGGTIYPESTDKLSE